MLALLCVYSELLCSYE